MTTSFAPGRFREDPDERWWFVVDPLLILATIATTILGALLVYSATRGPATDIDPADTSFLEKQLFFAVTGIGMAVGVLESDVYGLAVRARDLRRVLGDAANEVRAQEARLKELGCDPGDVDGVFDARTWEAYGCERARKN